MKTAFDRIVAGLALVAIAFFLIIGFKQQPSDASISNMTAQLGVYNSTDGTYGLEVDNNNQFHFSKTGAGIWYGISDIVLAGGTEQTLAANQTGQTFVDTATYGTGKMSLILPTAQSGLDYAYIAATTEQIQLIPQNADTIQYSTLTAGQAITNTSAAKGDHIEVRSDTANSWQIFDVQGTWSHGSP